MSIKTREMAMNAALTFIRDVRAQPPHTVTADPVQIVDIAKRFEAYFDGGAPPTQDGVEGGTSRKIHRRSTQGMER